MIMRYSRRRTERKVRKSQKKLKTCKHILNANLERYNYKKRGEKSVSNFYLLTYKLIHSLSHTHTYIRIHNYSSIIRKTVTETNNYRHL